jgi:hypothetical protein
MRHHATQTEFASLSLLIFFQADLDTQDIRLECGEVEVKKVPDPVRLAVTI